MTRLNFLNADLGTGAKSRRRITPSNVNLVDAGQPDAMKAIEVVNRTAAWASVAILDLRGHPSVLHAPPGSVVFWPVCVSQVSETGTTVSADVIIHGYLDA